MALSIPDRVVVFDYGEVISTTPSASDRAALVAMAGVDSDRFWPEYWRHRDALDAGAVPIRQYWRAIGDALGRRWGDALIHRLWLADYRSWLSVDTGTLDVLVDLKEGATRMALLSNAGADFGSYLRDSPLGSLFEAVFVSGELGMVKPAQEIFRHVMTTLRIDAAHMVFIDNKENNVAGARALGALGHVFTDADGLRAFLQSLAR